MLGYQTLVVAMPTAVFPFLSADRTLTLFCWPCAQTWEINHIWFKATMAILFSRSFDWSRGGHLIQFWPKGNCWELLGKDFLSDKKEAHEERPICLFSSFPALDTVVWRGDEWAVATILWHWVTNLRKRCWLAVEGKELWSFMTTLRCQIYPRVSNIQKSFKKQ